MSMIDSKFKSAGIWFCCAVVIGAGASGCSKESGAGDYLAAKDRIISTFNAEKAKCAQLSDNAFDVCLQRAQGDQSVALAELAFQYSGKAEDRAKVALAKSDATYGVAKEMCDEQVGSAKDACVKEAEAARVKAEAAAQASRTDTKVAAGNG